MTTVPADRFFHSEHMWVRLEGGESVLGITSYAQEKLGEVTLIDVPPLGAKITKDKPFGTVESAKVASDLFAPVNGEITAVNEKLATEPWLVNDDPYGRGWIVRIHLADPAAVSELLTFAQYEKLIA